MGQRGLHRVPVAVSVSAQHVPLSGVGDQQQVVVAEPTGELTGRYDPASRQCAVGQPTRDALVDVAEVRHLTNMA